MPPFLALALAVITRRVLLSLGIGIIVGALMLTGGNPLDGLLHLKDITVSLVYADGAFDWGKTKILLFLLLLGVFYVVADFFRQQSGFCRVGATAHQIAARCKNADRLFGIRYLY